MNLGSISPQNVTPGDPAKQRAPWLAKTLSRLGNFGRDSLRAFFPAWVFVLFVLLVILPTFLILSWMDPILGFDAKDVSRDYVLRYDGIWFVIIIGL